MVSVVPSGENFGGEGSAFFVKLVPIRQVVGDVQCLSFGSSDRSQRGKGISCAGSGEGISVTEGIVGLKGEAWSQDNGIFFIQVGFYSGICPVIVVVYGVDQVFLIVLSEIFGNDCFPIGDLPEGIGGIVEEIATGEIHFFAPFVGIVESKRIGGHDSSCISDKEIVVAAAAPLASTATAAWSLSLIHI